MYSSLSDHAKNEFSEWKTNPMNNSVVILDTKRPWTKIVPNLPLCCHDIPKL